MHGFLWSALIFLAAAVVAVPIFQKLGFGSVLGYLVAGILIGPSCFGFVTNVEDILHFSELGVVLLLFLIGLELEPRKLWQMRLPIFGMGGAQVILCTTLFSLLGVFLGFSWRSSLLAAMGFSLSSTALVLQVLQEKKKLTSDAGQKAFSILLFQDIAVIPMIAFLPLLAVATSSGNSSWLGGFKVAGVLLAVIVGGKIFLRPVLNWIAATRLREIFTALALLLVVGMALLMQSLELSMGLGAFMAGLLLAESEYRHALETDIEPFKGLLLGLFFISVGMSVNLTDVLAHPVSIFGLLFILVLVKILAHAGLAFGFGVGKYQVPFFAILLAQVGEFAFVLFDTALGLGIITAQERGALVAVGALSIFITPLLVKAYDFFLASRFEGGGVVPKNEGVEFENTPVIIAGFGRVGQIVGRFLFANGIKATVLDYEPTQIELLRRFGFKVFYGDATRKDLLEAAGAKQAQVLVVAIDDVDSNIALVDMAQKEFPHLQIVARVRNVGHLFDLKDRGVEWMERETFDGSLRLGRHVLERMGFQRHQAFSLAQKFRHFDEALMEQMIKDRGDEKSRISLAQQARADISRMFAEENTRRNSEENNWGAYDS